MVDLMDIIMELALQFAEDLSVSVDQDPVDIIMGLAMED